MHRLLSLVPFVLHRIDGNLQSLVGSWALVHVGFAMSIIDEEEARRTLEILAEIGELQEELDAMQNGA